jgi:hypothetical protein
MQKIKVFLTTGQVFLSPEANIENVKRIYQGKILRLEYPDEKKTAPESTPPTPPQQEEKAAVVVEQVVVPEPVAQPEPPKVEIRKLPPQKPIQPKLPPTPAAKEKADYTESKNRLKKVNAKRKPAAKKKTN